MVELDGEARDVDGQLIELSDDGGERAGDAGGVFLEVVGLRFGVGVSEEMFVEELLGVLSLGGDCTLMLSFKVFDRSDSWLDSVLRMSLHSFSS